MRRIDRSGRVSPGRLPVLLGVLGLLMASCGDSSDDGAVDSTAITTGADTSTTPTATATTEDTTTTTTTTASSTVDVVVFFGTGDADECAAVAPHLRSLPAGADPIRSAFDELVGGPTAGEVGDGAFSFFSDETEGSVRSATVTDGRLVVDLDDFSDTLTPAGANSSCGSGALLAELNSTAFQFSSVDLVRYEFEGSCDAFWEWLQRGCVEVERAAWADAVAALLPGEAAGGILEPGTIFGVVGVAVDDHLNVRARPGADQAIVATLDPLTTGLVYTGRARRLGPPTAVWYEVGAGEAIGWVNGRFTAPLAGTFDITSEVVDVAGETPTGATIEDIGAIVLEVRSRFADPKPSGIVVDGPSTGDLDEITYDLLGFGDDSVQGERLHLFVAPTDGGDDTLELRRVEVTYLCARGPGGGTGLCP